MYAILLLSSVPVPHATMNSLTRRKPLQTRILTISFTKFVSSLAIISDPPNIEANDLQHQDFTHLHPFHLLIDYVKSGHCSLKSTEILHAHLLKTAVLGSDIFVVNSLLSCYCKSGAVLYAVKLFDNIPQPNEISWNTIISGYNHKFMFEDSFRFFGRMLFSGFEPNEITYGSILSACAALKAPFLGEQMYSLALKKGFHLNGHVRTGMIDLFSKSNRFEAALRVFGEAPCEDAVSWNSIISGAVRNGENWGALNLFRQMCFRSVVPNSFTFPSVLTACATLEEARIGRGVHAWIIKYCTNDVFAGTALVDLYAKCGDISEAVKAFSRMPIRNVVSWTAIISGFVKNDDSISAFKLFKEMKKMTEEINSFTLTSVIAACAKPGMVDEAIQIHGWILKAGFYLDPVVGAALINMYSNIGVIDSSFLVFEEMKNTKNPGTWAAMISSLAQFRIPERTVELLQRMLQEDLRPNEFCFSSVLSVINDLNLGRQIHCYILKNGLFCDLSVGCSLFTMYSKCGSIGDSYRVFEQIPARDNISWTSIISGLAEHGYAGQAFGLFREMLHEGTFPDQMILTAILTACSNLRSLHKGKEVHGYSFRVGLNRELSVGGALITLYSRCGALKLAKEVFDMLPEKDEVSCSSLVSGYAQNGQPEEALFLFHEMSKYNLATDAFTFSSVLGAVATLNGSAIGSQLHGRITKLGLDSDVNLGSSLVTMYSKCGSIEDCCKAFDQIDEPDLIGWTAMISSYAQHGRGAEALKVYENMTRKGIRPDLVTFIGVLAACGHSGLVEEGFFYFNSMTKDFGIEPNTRHYACMVDLLGRSGKLNEAEKFINSMPVEPDAFIWATLLAACKVHGDVVLGTVAARKVMDLEPQDTGSFVVLSNILADIGQWEEVLEIRSLMKRSGVRKEPGWSSM